MMYLASELRKCLEVFAERPKIMGLLSDLCAYRSVLCLGRAGGHD
jgi:hypothetical protein